tara:strand:+ start:951 stop:1649 length:699 start_codon:yes stop_codon:yes gene_type:complete
MTKNLIQPAIYALAVSLALSALFFAAFFMAEPTIGHGQETASSTFYIRQTITDESSFSTEPVNVDMVGTINGVTGGAATGTTQFVVQSNNAAGYYVEIDFEYNANNEAMVGDESDSEAIRDYDGDVGGQPSVGFIASSSASMFAYTVMSSSSLDTDQSFFNNGAACNNPGSQATLCWKSPEASGFRIVDTADAAVDGATSTIFFHVDVPSGATPVPQAETYTATATLSLFVK